MTATDDLPGLAAPVGRLSEPMEAGPGQGPEILQRGRYAIEQEGDGSWFVLRAAPICEACQTCGCGDQQEPIRVTAGIVRLLQMDPGERAGLIKNPMQLLKTIMGAARE